MAVFTELSKSDVDQILEKYALGVCTALEPIGEGIENTNYFLDTLSDAGQKQRSVLTLFENLEGKELPYFAQLTEHLASAGFAVPAPVKMQDGRVLFQARDRYGMIVPRLGGKAKPQVNEQECAELGRWIAQMHLCLKDFRGKRPLVRNAGWMRAHCERLKEALAPSLFDELESAIARYEAHLGLLNSCTQGTVHGDLFRDNVLFKGGKISGVIDFYNASDATLLYDLAVAANDWTIDAGNVRNQGRLDALIQAYQGVRPWSEAEQRAWPYLLELAALRFWISRLASFHASGYQSAALSGYAIKDPEEMRQLMQLCKQAGSESLT